MIEAGERELLEMIATLNAAGCFSSGLNGWQQQGNKHRDDGDHNKEFDKCEPLSSAEMTMDPSHRRLGNLSTCSLYGSEACTAACPVRSNLAVAPHQVYHTSARPPQYPNRHSSHAWSRFGKRSVSAATRFLHYPVNAVPSRQQRRLPRYTPATNPPATTNLASSQKRFRSP